MKKLAIFSAAILCAASLSTTLANAATPGIYAGAGLGASKQNTLDKKDIKFDETPTSLSQDLGGVGGRIFTGYNFNKYVGVEGGFAHYAPSSYKAVWEDGDKNTLDINMNAVDLVGKAYLPFGESGFSAYALGGAAYVRSSWEVKKTSADANVKPEKDSGHTNKIRPVYGVGVSYDIPNSQVTTNLEFSRIQGLGDMKKDDNAIPSANMVTLNVSYNFGS